MLPAVEKIWVLCIAKDVEGHVLSAEHEIATTQTSDKPCVLFSPAGAGNKQPRASLMILISAFILHTISIWIVETLRN